MRTYAVRLVALLSLVAVGLGTSPSTARASCAGRDAAQVVADSGVVLSGRLTVVEDPGGAVSPHDVAWTIDVAAVHKGQAPSTSHVAATEYSHEDVVEGGSYVFALTISDATLRAGGCQDVARVGTAEAAAIADAAGPGRAPAGVGAALPGSVSVDLPGGGMSLVTMLVIGLVGLLVVTLGGLALAVGLGFLTARRGSGERDRGGDGEGGAAGSGDAAGRMSDSSETPPS